MKREEEEAAQETALSCEEALIHFRQAIADGAHWYPALLESIALWRLPEETVGDRHYRYLIDGEAFDYLLLAERLTEELNSVIPDDEREALLFRGQPPVDLDHDEFKRLMGNAKHTAYLNYLYGVTVEEALQLAVEEELNKERYALCGAHHVRIEEEVWQRIYGKGRAEMLSRYRLERDLPAETSLSFTELKSFTYWLFKYRVRNCDRARVASDTRKALHQLARLERARRRRLAG
jgi:hypothetical protein